ncbi:winged helix-turn-helix domain-containing protein [Paraburkholderia tropica]|uniref:ATP-binding protein n=1 Tax=Paraburkholderia tropica TaxID=92647 RepID=UPI0030195ECD
MTSATSELCTFASAHEFGSRFIRFGETELDIGMRVLRQGSRVLELGSRAFDLLATLAQASGRVVHKDELIDSVWPDTIVDENALHVHLSTIRKVIGQDSKLIVTVPRRGYQLIASPSTPVPAANFEDDSQRTLRTAMMPMRSALLGRETAIDVICALMRDTRVLTLVGPGGIGKTSIALEIAHRTSGSNEDDVHFVDVSDQRSLGEVLLAFGAIGPVAREDGEPDLDTTAAMLTRIRGLIVIDNAEHVADPVAQLLERACHSANPPRFLVTSRQPLRIPAETVYRVTPLAVSGEATEPCDANGSPSPAIALFLRRLSHDGRHRVIDDELMTQAAEICRCLDGIPLAIELAASRAAILGLEPVLNNLADPLPYLDGGYRTACARHKSLLASIKWSFDMLESSEQTVFQRLSVFDGAFDAQAASALASDVRMSPTAVMQCVSELVDHSLLDIHFDGAAVTYRLLTPSKSFGRQRLAEAGELATMVERRADYLRSAARSASAQQAVLSPVSFRS